MIAILALLGLATATQATNRWPICSRPDSLGAPAARPAADTLARRFAPVLLFGPGERYFPTIPFFTAFDRSEDGGDPRRDGFRDPWEIAPWAHPDRRSVSWTALDAVYRPPDPAPEADHGRAERGLERVVVFYRVCELTAAEGRALRRFLRSDEQAWARFQEDVPLDRVVPDTMPFDVVQYYLYYLRDVGLQGHPQDIELVSLFLPRDSTLYDQFRVVVGSGHSDRTPNNVLVLSAPHRGVGRLHDLFHHDEGDAVHGDFADNLKVLVELGGHSSAPDMPPYGSYTPGVDVNWHIYDVWGTRDVQAVGGVGYIGSYRPEMTFDRDVDAVRVFPPTFSPEEIYLVQQALAPQRADTGREARPPHQYRLVDVDLLVRLDRALADTSGVAAARRRRVAQLVGAIQEALREAQGATSKVELRSRALRAPDATGLGVWEGTPFAALSAVEQDTAIAAMQRWRQDMTVTRAVAGGAHLPERRVPAAKHRIWEHGSFTGDPTAVFKSHLFRPNIFTVENPLELLVFGVKGSPGDAYEIYAGFVVPAFRSHSLPVRLGGFVEVHAGWYRSNFWSRAQSSAAVSLVWEHHRNALFSWYNGASWVPRRAEVTGDPDAGDFSLTLGVSLLPLISRAKVLNALRLRTGVRLDPFERDVVRRVRWEFQVAVRQ